MNTNHSDLTVGTRIYNKGDMANLPKYGTITALPESGYIHVRYDDGSESVFMPVALFAAPHARCKVVHIGDAPPVVDTVSQFAVNGRYARKATRVRFADGREVVFMDRIGKRAAIRQALAQLS